MTHGQSTPRPPLALIAGPTASGKSDYALRLAGTLAAQGRAAVIINADSAQLYADLPILSAAPSPAETAVVPHRLYGTWDGAQACSAAEWAARARAAIAQAHAEDAVPIVVGGTGFYLRTLLDGIAPVPPIDPAIRAQVRAMPVADAYPALTALDPDRAATLNPADITRIARALEVHRSTGLPLVHWQARTEGGIGGDVALSPLVLLPDRDWLYERCDRRFALMIARGAIDEVSALLARELDPVLPVMQAIGVAEIGGYLRGEWSLDEAIERGTRATRRYAKRQYTWFRNQMPATWPRGEAESVDMNAIFVSLFQR